MPQCCVVFASIPQIMNLLLPLSFQCFPADQGISSTAKKNINHMLIFFSVCAFMKDTVSIKLVAIEWKLSYRHYS